MKVHQREAKDFHIKSLFKSWETHLGSINYVGDNGELTLVFTPGNVDHTADLDKLVEDHGT